MKTSKTNTLKLTRCAAIAGLYVALNLITAPISYGPIQFRIAEGLTIMPIFFAESPLGLFIGCLLSNVFSGYGIFDIVLGSLTTLIAGYLTKFIYRKTKSFFLAGLPPIILNAIVIPLVFLLSSADVAYFINFISILLSQTVSVYGVGLPIYFAINRLIKKDSKFFK